MKIYHKSDFDFVLHLTDCDNAEIRRPFPDCDWDAVFWTGNKANSYTASRRGDVYVNCAPTTDGGMHFVFDNHRLGAGILCWRPHFALPDNAYPDGKRDVYREAALDIELTDGQADCPTTAEITAMLPYIPLKFQNLTEAEKAEIAKPAAAAADEVAKLESGIITAETAREKAEQARIAAEQSRQTAETARQTAESDRQTAETARQTAEAQRETAETARQTAEQSREQAESTRVAAESQRAETFAGWREAIEGSGSATSPTYTFDAQWTAAGGTVITPGKVYECNGTDDLSFAEAVGIYEWYTKAFTADCSYRFNGYPHRTMLPVCGTSEKQITADRMFYYAKKIKVIKFRSPAGTTPPYVDMTRPTAAFMRCEALREIGTPIRFSASPDSAFNFCAALEEVRLYKLAYNVSFGSCSLLSLASLRYLVDNAANTKAITLTVHADVFAKLTDESNTEWHAVAVAALAKNITIATT